MQKYYFQCVNCFQEFPGDPFLYLCPECSKTNVPYLPPKGVLWIRYDDESTNKKNIDTTLESLIPLDSMDSMPPLKIGETPIYHYKELNNQSIPFELLIKDESQNPSYSFKDRASALVSAFAKENKYDTIVAASTGNAGSSLACICASQSQKAVILLPEAAPEAKSVQVQMYGAQLIKVKGNYDVAFEESLRLGKINNWFNRNTAYNPLTIEGKKSVSFEIFKQLNGDIPDAIFIPVGDGVILSGVYKGFEDLYSRKYIDKIPQIFAVQSNKSSNVFDNFKLDKPVFKSASSLADSINVDVPRNFYMASYYLKKYNGNGIQVSDSEIMDASYILSSSFGLFAEPASAAAFAGFLKANETGLLNSTKKVLVLHTGSGLKDVFSAANYLNLNKRKEK